jgi:hypothetical protein
VIDCQRESMRRLHTENCEFGTATVVIQQAPLAPAGKRNCCSRGPGSAGCGIGNSRITQGRSQVGMPQPLLDLASENPGFMVQRRKRAAKFVQLKLVAHRRLAARLFLAIPHVEALAAVQTRSFCQLFRHSQKMTVWPPLLVRKQI